MVEYRKTTPEDANSCVKILRHWIDETNWMPMLHSERSMRQFWRGRLDQTAGWVAIENGQIVGFCIRDGGDITALYLDPSARGKGVGKGLLDLAREDRDEVSLWVFEANTKARAFYTREGFAEVLRSEGDNEEGLPDIKLSWTN